MSGIRVFNGKRYTIHSVLTKEPTKTQLDSLKKEYNVRVVKEKHPQFGYRFIVMTSPWIGKYAENIKPKQKKKSTKKTTKKSKKS